MLFGSIQIKSYTAMNSYSLDHPRKLKKYGISLQIVKLNGKYMRTYNNT